MWPYERPTLSPDAERSDDAGACAVAEYFLASLPYDAAHGRHTTIDRYAPDCATCQEFADETDNERRNGGWTRGDYAKVTGRSIIGPQDGDDESIVYCTFDIQTDECQTWDGVSNSIKHYSSGSGYVVFQMRHTDHGWHVEEWGSHIDREVS
ncbi:hypothetical protein H8R18_00070 [Nanchangia anserum]|uniref:DUF6318 domain-containing protein n=1 Tax=Nanchangia anserum TaxID=2692125 RepID=A0A8I0KNU1_9ACTO|nr:DUF6318 family protein [Nanchangia anserum]MBD3689646.1 hypothetical protein [Nanchangia anserum]QOX81828.1 hypothetical protein H8R18_00070 [Nanchangia anserum]